MKVKAWPNPATDAFVILIEGIVSKPVELVVYDIFGKHVYAAKGNTGQRFVFGNELPKGTYMAVIKQEKQLNSIKLVKQ